MNLPTEIIREIVGHLTSLPDLARCARVNHAFGQWALAALYHEINLNRANEESVMEDDEEEEEDEEEDPSSSQFYRSCLKRRRDRNPSIIRQQHLLRTIAERPNIGRLVNSFQNTARRYPSEYLIDATENDQDSPHEIKTDDELLVSAAENMKMLRRADLSTNLLADTILKSLPSYPRLQELRLRGTLDPIKYAWTNAALPLTRLTCTIPLNSWKDSPWDSARSTFIFAMSACQNLRRLDISYDQYLPNGFRVLLVDDDGEFHCSADSIIDGPTLGSLQHFSFTANLGGRYDSASLVAIEAKVLDFVAQHRNTLISWITSVGQVGTRQQLTPVLQRCKTMPSLRALALHNRSNGAADESDPAVTPPSSYLEELMHAIVNPNPLLEQFTLSTVGIPFSPSVGKLFRPWQHLRFLRLGDGGNTKGPFITRKGRLDFKAYQSKILHFIQELPPSLEELYLEINGEEMRIKASKDFDPICAIGRKIFTSLRRLHTCDIIARLSSFNYHIAPYPIVAVHWRRLRHETNRPDKMSLMSAKLKDLWQSRLRCRCEYHNRDGRWHPWVKHERLSMLLDIDEGVFEGKDAREAWLGGYTYEKLLNEDRAWPYLGDPVISYPMHHRF